MANVIRIAPGVVVFLCLAIFLPATLQAQEVIAVVEKMQGRVEVERDGGRNALAQGAPLYPADLVRTGPDAAAGLKFSDGALIALGPDTVYRLDDYRFDPSSGTGRFTSSIRRGSLSIRSGRIAKKGKDRMQIRTPATILGVRGTRFLVSVEPDR